MNAIPIFEQTTGYSPFLVQQGLKHKECPTRTMSVGNGVCRFNHDRDRCSRRGHIAYRPIKGLEAHFSVYTDTLSRTFATSRVKTVGELVQIVEGTAAGMAADEE